jgi:hypothetical protein
MLNICYDPTAPTPSGASNQAKHAELEAELRDQGVYEGGAGLFPVGYLPPLRLRGEKALDGPFAETKEALGGFFVVNCSDLEQARSIAERIAVNERSWVEIRQVGIWRPK